MFLAVSYPAFNYVRLTNVFDPIRIGGMEFPYCPKEPPRAPWDNLSSNVTTRTIAEIVHRE